MFWAVSRPEFRPNSPDILGAVSDTRRVCLCPTCVRHGYGGLGEVSVLCNPKSILEWKDVSKVINISGRFALERGIEGRLGKEFMQIIKRDGFIDVKDKSVYAKPFAPCGRTPHGEV
ncbi:hypothetical protein QJS10_CPB18g00770 [Acorus calamus]|uniref:Uncharacterized protein n=1 Tax=Acorus calamus TaxID=4465 RepID=A0AAV9CMQ7_ACOCL|nr:hypothetical protein QJS10_CPB18g00770 [Acorus calamus]